MLASTLLPTWIVLPPAAMLMLVIAGHQLALGQSKHPASRRRIRQANGVIMLLTVPLIAAGIGVISPDRQPALWMLVWIAVMALLAFSVSLAMLDSLNTIRLARRARRRLRASLRMWRQQLDTHAARGRQHPDAPDAQTEHDHVR